MKRFSRQLRRFRRLPGYQQRYMLAVPIAAAKRFNQLTAAERAYYQPLSARQLQQQLAVYLWSDANYRRGSTLAQLNRRLNAGVWWVELAEHHASLVRCGLINPQTDRQRETGPG